MCFRKIIAVLILLLCNFVPSTRAADDGYNVLVKRVTSMSASEITDIADSAHDAGDDRKAMALYMSVCNRTDADPSEEERQASVRACLGAGDILLDKGSYAEALKMYVQGLKASDSCREHTYVASLYKNIGNVYCRLYDYERGITYYKKALTMCRGAADRVTEKKTLVNLAGVYVILGNAAEARKYHDRAHLISTPYDKELTFMDRYNYGSILAKEKSTGKALECFRSLIGYASKWNLHKRYLCSAYQQMHRTFSLAGQNDSSLRYMKKCLDTARANNIEHMFLTVMLDMSKHYEKAGDLRSAQEYKNRYLSLKDSMLDSRQVDAIKHIQFIYETGKVSDRINLLQQQKREREQTIRHQRIIIFGISAMALIVAVFFYLIYRQKKKLHRSYSVLYSVNSRYVSMQEEMRRLHNRDLRLLQEKEEEIASLKSTADAGQQKYSSSKLDTGRSQTIADAISEAMDEKKAFCNPDFNLDILSGIVGSNSKYVSQVINERFGKNFSAFINEYRVNLACLRLSDPEGFGSWTVKAIGESVGFKSQSTFINVFRKMTGMTPSVYQKIAEREKIKQND